jgi:hypothetical protein
MSGQTVRKKIIENAADNKILVPEKIVCPLPFNRVHISSEGYFRACCSDYQNYLAIADLNKVSLREAFYSQQAMEHRRRILAGATEGLICHSCLYGSCTKEVKPLSEELSAEAPQDFFGGVGE